MMKIRNSSLLFVVAILACLDQSVQATKVTFDEAAGANNQDIPLNYGSYIAGNSTGFITTDGSGATPHIGLTWVGNVPNEWEYHTATTWTHESPVFVAQMDQDRELAKDRVNEIVFAPIDGRSVAINSFLLTGATNQGAAAEWTWEVVGTAFSDVVSVPVGGNTGTINVGFTGTPGTSYTLRFTRTQSDLDTGYGTALDDLSFSEILSPNAPVFKLTVDRSTGGITLTNTGSTSVDIRGYTISSSAGSLRPEGWKSISGNYDVNGTKSVDVDDDWTKLSAPDSTTDFSEYEFGGNGGTIAPSASVVLNAATPNSKGIAWVKSPIEDLKLDLVLANGDIMQYSVEYINGPEGGFKLGDLNFDGSITELDWSAYNAGRGVDLSNMSAAAAYQYGDLDGDFDNDITDFVIFKGLFDSAQAIAADSVPEPASAWVLIAALGSCLGYRRTRRNQSQSYFHRRTFVKSLCILLTSTLVLISTLAGTTKATTLNFNLNTVGEVPANNSDLDFMYGSNATAGNLIGATAGAEGFTPNIAINWGPMQSNVLELHSAASFMGFGFTVPVLQLDMDAISGQFPGDPTIDFNVSGGKSLKLDSFKIGNATDQTEAPYSWTISLLRLSDMATVATRTTGMLTAGSLETVNFNFTGTINEDYRLVFDDGGANRVRTAIDDLTFSETDVVSQLKLVVNTATGNISIVNNSGQDFDIDSYEITSSTNSLNPGGWNSLQDQDFEGNGAPGTGNGWEEAGGVGTHQLIESFGFGSSIFSNGMTPISLGNAFDTTKPAEISFEYHLTGSGGFLIPGEVEFITSVTDADFDGDGDIDGSDFLVWQAGNGAAGGPSQGDANGDGQVNAADFNIWASQYGTSNGGGSLASTSIPEPSTLAILALVALAFAILPRRNVS